jgi:hypothetical protein
MDETSQVSLKQGADWIACRAQPPTAATNAENGNAASMAASSALDFSVIANSCVESFEGHNHAHWIADPT